MTDAMNNTTTFTSDAVNERRAQFAELRGSLISPTRINAIERTMGPDWSLAAALLECGERDTVCEYLNGCKKFLKHDKLIDGWTAAIRKGKTPDLVGEWFEFNYVKKRR